MKLEVLVESASAECADEDGLTATSVVELGPQHANRADVLTELRVRRRPRVGLGKRFMPGAGSEQPPLMRYGLALSNHDVLCCVRRLGIAPKVLDLSKYSGMVKDSPYDPAQDHGYQLDARRKLLIHMYDQPEIGKAALGFAFRNCFVPDDKDCVLSLYSNYSRGEKKWSSSKRKRNAVEAKVAELLCPDAVLKARFRWYWDEDVCGFGYCAPWNEFNLWPITDTPGWSRDVHDPYPTLGRLTRKIPRDRGEAPI